MTIAARISHPSPMSKEPHSAIPATLTLTTLRQNLTTYSRPILPALAHLQVPLRPAVDPPAKTLEHLRHFVSLDVRRQGQLLAVEAVEVIAPMPTRGGKGREGSRKGGARPRPAKT